MDFYGFTFDPETVLTMAVGAWATGLFLGGITAVLASLASRR